MKKLKLLDTFAGIGGFSYAAEKIVGGYETTQFIEINPFSQKILKKHWPHVPIHDDIKTFTARPFQFDVVCGGFPCQDISVAGHQKGITKKSRSGLFYELIRVIRLVRPKFIVLENVAAIINHGLDIVLGELSQAGYDAEWSIISASSLGGWHRRSRWWLVAYPNSDGYQGQCFETRNKATPGEDLQIIRSTNTSELERCSNDEFNKRESRIDESLSRSSDGREAMFTEPREVCDLSQESNNNKRISSQDNYQEDNDRTLVSEGQSRVQLSQHRKLGRDKTTSEGDTIRQGNDNSTKQRMDYQESNVTHPISQRTQIQYEQRRSSIWNLPSSYGEKRSALNPNWQAYESKPCLRRGNDGLSNWIHRLKALGNSVVPQVAAIPMQRVLDIEKNINK